MTAHIRNLLIIFPVLVLTGFYLHDHYSGYYAHTSFLRIMIFSVTVLLLYSWILYDLLKSKPASMVEVGVKSSFYVYIFMVLTLTGYFILFREVSMHDWWHKMIVRVEKNDRVNLQLFKVFKIYRITNRQVLGNLVMLFPLGIYLPLLYRKMSGLFRVTFFCMCFSVGIELLQLITSFRSTDIDDVFLNTSGAILGYLTYMVFINYFQYVRPFHQADMDVNYRTSVN